VRNWPSRSTGIAGERAHTARPAAKSARIGGSVRRAPKRSTARPAIGIVAIVARLVAVKTSPYSCTMPRSRRTSGRIVATTRAWIAASASSNRRPAVSRPRRPLKTSRQRTGGGPGVPEVRAAPGVAAVAEVSTIRRV
jgi:hypothetical protein